MDKFCIYADCRYPKCIYHQTNIKKELNYTKRIFTVTNFRKEPGCLWEKDLHEQKIRKSAGEKLVKRKQKSPKKKKKKPARAAAKTRRKRGK